MLERVWRKRNPSTHWWECKLVQPLWKTTRKFLRKGKIESPFVGVQSLSRLWLFATPWTVARQVSLSLTISWSLLRLMSIEVVMPSNQLILCHPLLLLFSILVSIRVFINESVLCIRWPKYWSFSFSISPSNEYSGLVFFRIDWFDLLASDRVWFTGEGNDKLLQYPCLRNPMNSMKR